MNGEGRLEFNVIGLTSVDDSLSDGNFFESKPWISEKSCAYPQQVLLQTVQKASVNKIRILCHSAFITSGINLYASGHNSADKTDLEFLGTVMFHEATREDKNELKTILTDRIMQYIKLECQQNYFDRRRNPHNQVGIILIELFGQYIGDESSVTNFENESDTTVQSPQSVDIDGFPNSYVPRLFTPMKMHVANSSLVKHDYRNPSRSRSHSLDIVTYTPKSTSITQPALAYSTERTPAQRYSPATTHRQRRNKENRKTKNRFLEKENAIVPAALVRSNNGWPMEHKFTEKDALLNAIHPGDRADVSKAIELYGLLPIRNTYSKKWKERVNGFNEIIVILQEIKNGDITDYVESLLPMLCSGLKDNLFMVYSAALETLKLIALELIPDRKTGKMLCTTLAARTLSLLINRAGDTDKRFSKLTYEAVMTILHSDPKVVKPFMVRLLLPLKTSGSVRSDFGKAEMVWNAVTQLEAPNSQIGLTEKAISIFGLSCLEHNSSKVRDFGKALLIYAYKKFKNRKAIRAALSNVQRSTAENDFLLRIIRDQFDVIDNGTTPSSRSRGLSQEIAGDDAFSEYSISSTGKRDSNKLKTVRLVAHNNRPESYDYDKMCMYCGAKSEDFTKEGLDMHYLNKCYMLTKCSSCSKIIEISTMKEHLLEKCAAHSHYVNCPICDEPILRENFNRHLAAKQCKEMIDPSAGRCLLCHEDVTPNNDIGWRTHLRSRCTANTRTM